MHLRIAENSDILWFFLYSAKDPIEVAPESCLKIKAHSKILSESFRILQLLSQ